MALSLKPVPPSRGARWVGDGFKLFKRRPLSFLALFAVFVVAFVLLAQVPVLGRATLVTLPLLSLGFMVAGRSALQGGPVRASQFIEPLRTDAPRRRALLVLCAIYGVAMLGIIWLADIVSDDAIGRMQRLIAEGAGEQALIEAMQADAGLRAASTTLALLGTLLTIPFWHAAALVHWGGQGVFQSLFSSTVALWRARAAFALYAVIWFAVAVLPMPLVIVMLAVVFGMLGAPQVVMVLVWLVWAVFWSVFYLSVLFTFSDSFGTTAAPEVPASDTIET